MVASLGLSVALHLVLVAMLPWGEQPVPIRVVILDEDELRDSPPSDGALAEAVASDAEAEESDNSEAGLSSVEEDEEEEDEPDEALRELWEAEEEAREAEAEAAKAEARAQAAAEVARREMQEGVREREPEAGGAEKPQATATATTAAPTSSTLATTKASAAAPTTPTLATNKAPAPSKPEPSPRVELRKLDANLARAEAEARKVEATLKRARADALRERLEARVAAASKPRVESERLATAAPEPKAADHAERAAAKPEPARANERTTFAPPRPSLAAVAIATASPRVEGSTASGSPQADGPARETPAPKPDRTPTRVSARDFDPHDLEAKRGTRRPMEQADAHDLEAKRGMTARSLALVTTPDANQPPAKAPRSASRTKPQRSSGALPPPPTARERAPDRKPATGERVATSAAPATPTPTASASTPRPTSTLRPTPTASASTPKPAPTASASTPKPTPTPSASTPKPTSTASAAPQPERPRTATAKADTREAAGKAAEGARRKAQSGGEEGDGAVTARWLRYVHTDGTPSPDPIADALYIGGRNVVVARETWAPTNTERSFGSGKVEGDAIPGIETPETNVGFAPAETAPDATGLFYDGAPTELDATVAGSDTPTPSPTRLRLSLIPTDPGDGTTAPSAELHAPRADLPRPTRAAPTHLVDGSAPAPSAGAAAPPEEDAFWSPIVGEGHSPSAGAARHDGTAWSSLEVTDRELARGEVGAVNVRKTELGTWADGVDTTLRKASRLPIELRGLGYSGVVEIDMRIRRNGVVERVRVLRSSGVLALDELAIAAIPERVPAPPIAEPWLPFRYTFRFGT